LIKAKVTDIDSIHKYTIQNSITAYKTQNKITDNEPDNKKYLLSNVYLPNACCF